MKGKLTDSIYRSLPVLVLGATGFIGRWVSRELSKSGASLYTIVRDKKRAEGIFQRYEIDAVVYQGDLCDDESIKSLLNRIRPCVTFNLTGYGVDREERDVEMSYKMNSEVVGTISRTQFNIRDDSWRGRDFIHVGSALEYGDIRGNLSESSIPQPTTIYGKSKLEGTKNLKEYCSKSGLKGLTARLFTVYGPGEHRGRLLPSLIETAQKGTVLKLTMGDQKRDFTYVADIATGLIRLALSNATPGSIVNLCSGQLTTVKKFIETASSVLGINREMLAFGALKTRSEEMEHSPVSNKRLQSLIDWVPPTSIEGGIRKTKIFIESHNCE